MAKILLVEDEDGIRQIYSKKLKEAGYSVDEAQDGKKGIELASKNRYDLILLDIMLPEISGFDVLKSIRNLETDSKETPIFLLTNLGLEETIKEAQNLGVQRYLIKAHFTPNAIVDEINKLFETKDL